MNIEWMYPAKIVELLLIDIVYVSGNLHKLFGYKINNFAGIGRPSVENFILFGPPKSKLRLLLFLWNLFVLFLSSTINLS